MQHNTVRKPLVLSVDLYMIGNENIDTSWQEAKARA